MKNELSVETQANQSQVEFVEAKVSFTKDRKHLLHNIGDQLIIKKHVNFYKKLFGIPFTPEKKQRTSESEAFINSLPDFEPEQGIVT